MAASERQCCACSSAVGIGGPASTCDAKDRRSIDPDELPAPGSGWPLIEPAVGGRCGHVASQRVPESNTRGGGLNDHALGCLWPGLNGFVEGMSARGASTQARSGSDHGVKRWP